ncbi:DDE-type integrase/transposase/recombinase [Streptomyces tropicalis]|uniref:DDE-type integrase/transposase/recombinase n=1 Tax=Streptomyces tropicalis TaxID=3034234 RepID=A0ABT6A647_9ACTN|nr:DDE-type integrase/transposase/recombinase [Streptomyces tropicalis]MDF3300116.1 DDE-type integrase/transposase/recombinase [Streptomyces tropicalis]
MRQAGLVGAVRGRRVRTTVPGKDGCRAGDLVNRDFAAVGPDRLRGADFTYVPCWSGTVYVAFCVDAFSRRILGWKAVRNMHTALVLDVVEQALWQRGYRKKQQVNWLIHHSDADSQYTSIAFTERLAQAGIAPSIGALPPATVRDTGCPVELPGSPAIMRARSEDHPNRDSVRCARPKIG